MAKILSAFVALAIFAAVARSQPAVSLLIDNGYPSTGSIDLTTVLADVSTKKGQTFHFGSTYDTYDADQSWFDTAFATFYHHVVSENGCKWDATEPTQGVSDLTECLATQSFATTYDNSFRGHNTFWHEQTPTWLPGSFTADELVGTIIPQHVQQEIQGMGTSVTSWDVVNEVVGDGVTTGMTALECVQNKGDWPTVTSDGSGVPLVTDLSFVYAAFKTAYTYAGSSTRLAVNDYNTGGQDAKTACVISLVQSIQQNTSIPYDRLAIGFQSHLMASTGNFYTKEELATTFSTLAALGVNAMITEMDIEIGQNNTAYLRYQASIWGDYVDACLYASNCNEFINWDPRDDLSWRGVAAAATLFDASGNPKPAAYEVAARLQNYAAGNAEPCSTSSGTSVCTITGTGTTTTGTTTTTSTGGSTTTSISTTTTSSTGGSTGCVSALYGQCAGIGWTGCAECATGSTCTFLNDCELFILLLPMFELKAYLGKGY
ncbi:glycoside hydrolase superfamily [Mycena maculata]|uniref:Beta-xylanase n=1 Tax=Mycena maculata TaxID=230809 RepID=A0AAD7KEG5_9AGAR|nr:glycoside hydrolase superfamily [Mycena maculata]